MDPFKLKSSKKTARTERPGYQILVPGSCLKPGSETWDERHREAGIFLRFVFPTSSEEEGFIAEAQNSGNAGSISLIQVRGCIVAVALAVTEPEVKKEGDAPGEEKPAAEAELKPGTWERLEKADVRGFWEELGPQGRLVAVQAFNLANAPDEGAARKAMASFCAVG